ncbi:hypothetical protein ACFL3S_05545 [Gemmatimonadota bacterium]
MSRLAGRYKEALDLLNLSELSRETGRALRTLQAYRREEWEPSEAAVTELIGFLRDKSRTWADVADKLAALQEEERDA